MENSFKNDQDKNKDDCIHLYKKNINIHMSEITGL